MKKTNFDRYLEEQLKDPDFTERFERVGEVCAVSGVGPELAMSSGIA